MKKILLLLFLIPLVKYATAADSVYVFCYFRNNGEDGLHLAYSKDGYNWQALRGDSSVLRPAAGKDKLMRDPCIIRGADGQFHMVWTVSWNERGIGYASSPDLLHWSSQQTIPVMEHEPTARNCWAPEITWDPRHRQYVIYWATTIPGRFTAGDTAGDDKYNHRLYYTTTKDFKHYPKAALMYDKGFNVIDATIQPAGKGWVMWLKDETRYPPQKNIRIARSKNLTKGFGNPSAPITGNYWAEGPTVLPLHNKWIVYFDKYRDHRYGAVESTDLEHWTDVSDKLHMPPGVRHGTVFKISEKELEVLQ